MHLIKDENGNHYSSWSLSMFMSIHMRTDIPIHMPHTHEHGHEEEHHHHHDHDHGCEGSCDTGCSGCSGAAQGPESTACQHFLAICWIIMKAMPGSWTRWLARSAEAGMSEAAEQIKKGVAEFQKGNMYLSLALSMVKEDK